MTALRPLIASLAVICLALGACAGSSTTSIEAGQERTQPEGDTPHERMTEDQIPDEAVAPTQQGDGSAKSFEAFMAQIRESFDGLAGTRPDTAAELTKRVAVAAAGTITNVELVPVTLSLGDLTAAQIELHLTLETDTAIKGDTSPTVWVIEAWIGDPVAADKIQAKLAAELGAGPIGARAILYGQPINPETADGPVTDRATKAGDLTIYDGLVEDETGTARLTVFETSSPELLTVDQAIAESK